MVKKVKFGVTKTYIDASKVKVYVTKLATDTTFQIELTYEDHPDLERNVDAFARYLADKIEQVLEE
jgi:hypothetical protein